MQPEKTIFEKLQSLEFLSLIASAASTVTLNKPILCNGANLAFEKEAYQTVGGIKDHQTYASGDDLFLLKQIKYKLNEKVGFIKHADAIVYTKAQTSLTSFIHQRIRWVSKSKGTKDLFSIFVSFTVYLFNLTILTLAIIGLFQPLLLNISLAFLLIKILIDLPVLAGISFFMRRVNLLGWYIPLQIINIFYVTYIGFIGNFKSFTWKERLYKK